ncbi:hypothetical protein ACHQM5_002136 [Ranunculus cassubicifolius]
MATPIQPHLLGPPEVNLDDETLTLNQLNPVSPPMGLTENSSPTYLSSGNPCLDFFFHVLPDTPKDSLIARLKLAWEDNPLTTLKLICHLRGVRGTGKSDKEGFYAAALWLYTYHPRTLALNVRWFAEFGYLKDLLEILYRILEGFDVRKKAKGEREKSGLFWKRGKRHLRTKRVITWRKGRRVAVEKSLFAIRKSAKTWQTTAKIGRKKLTGMPKPVLSDWITIAVEKKKKNNSRTVKTMRVEEVKPKTESVTVEKNVKPTAQNLKVEKKKSSEVVKQKKTPRFLRHEKHMEMAKKALQRYISDPNYRLLHDKVSDLFAELLVSDIIFLKEKKFKEISLASKWCPSLDSSFDKSTLICESIAKRVFPRESYPEYKEIEEAHYAYRVRDRLRKDVLVPLRQALQLPEIFMSAKKWKSLPYTRVASVAMTLYKGLFIEHDQTRFAEHLENVKKGKAKIAAGALLPHDILGAVDSGSSNEETEVAELQWKRMVEDLSQKGKMKNCLAVCDVSGSMSGTPMDVCIALGLLLSELCDKPWNGKVITFSRNPTLQTITGDTLREKKEFVRHMNWGMNTDFQKVFDLILQVAVKGKLSQTKMIKRLFVFSDMEFDQASANTWETDYQAIQRKFTQKGYGSAVPEIVFWNLRDSTATPVAATEKGVALVSGYSKNLLRLFLDGDDQMNPEVIMLKAISGAEYKNLSVFD